MRSIIEMISRLKNNFMVRFASILFVGDNVLRADVVRQIYGLYM